MNHCLKRISIAEAGGLYRIICGERMVMPSAYVKVISEIVNGNVSKKCGEENRSKNT